MIEKILIGLVASLFTVLIGVLVSAIFYYRGAYEAAKEQAKDNLQDALNSQAAHQATVEQLTGFKFYMDQWMKKPVAAILTNEQAGQLHQMISETVAAVLAANKGEAN